ncbi:ATP-binding cassette domain-containing protein [Devosia sp. SL43]|nr:ATP-binding cassette domain-containing protein [Devosia sp. SL43]
MAFVKALPLGRLSPLRRLLPFLLRYRLRLVLTLVFLVASTLASLAVPFNLGSLIDTGFIAQDMGMISRYAWIIAAFGILGAVTNGFRLYLVSYVGERMLADLRLAVFGHLLTLDAAFFDRQRMGELASRLNGDVAAVRAAISSTASVALRSLVTMVGAFIFMLLTSPVLTLAVVIAGPLILIPMLMLARRLRKMSRRSQDALAELSAQATEILSANRTVKSFTREDEEVRRYRRHGNESFESELSRLRARAFLVGLLMLMSSLAMIFTLWWGAQAVFAGAATTGELTQFLLYGVMGAGAVASLAEVAGTLQSVAGSTERLVEILDTKPAIQSPARPLPLPVPALGTVEFRDVSFRYGATDAAATVSDLCFAVGQGTTTALVGMSGGGKSTIFALLQRLYEVGSGSILVDGLDIRQVDIGELRRRIAVVEQDPIIFSGTIEDNIRFGKPDASRQDVVQAATDAMVDEFVAELPAGYDTLVGERGVTLSGGQRQRLAIARALLKDAPILLLDEATSALDAGSEQLVQLALKRLQRGRTTLVIAHRLATIRDADTILVLDKGKIVDQGVHDELMARDGRYAQLGRLQFNHGD